MHRIGTLFLMSGLVLAMGCSTLYGVRPDEMSKVKKIAVIGFLLEEEQPPYLSIELGKRTKAKLKHGKSDETFGEIIAEPRAKQVYDGMVSKLSKHLGIEIATPQSVAANSLYHEVAYGTRLRMVSGTMIGKKAVEVKNYGIVGITSPANVSNIDLEERAQLMKELKADAVALITLRVRIEKEDTLKIGDTALGSYQTYARTEVELYNATADEPIWVDKVGANEKSDVSSFQISGFNLGPLDKAVVDASLKSIDGTLVRYDTAVKQVATN